MKKTLQTISMLAIFILILMSFNSLTYAASTSYAKISASSPNINVGDTVTVNVEIFAGSWVVNISGGGLEAVGDTLGLSGQTSKEGNSSASKTYNFKANSAGTYTISLSGDITDYDTDENIDVNKSVTITVKEKEQEPAPEEPTNPVTPEPQPEEQVTPTTPETPSEENPGEENPNNQTQQEPTFTSTNKTMYSTTGLNVRASYSANSDRIGYLNTGDSITVLAIGSNGWYKVKMSNGKEGYVAGSYLTDTKPTESSIATLDKIEVNPSKLNETFSKNTLLYTMTVEADVDSVTVNATPTDSNATVTVTGNTGLTTGTGNTISIKVVAENGSTRTYTIKVTKLATEDENPNIIEEPEEKGFGLSSLEIEGLKLTPTFKSDIYEYTATLTDKEVEKLTVNAVPSIEDAKVEITGADEIKDGENIITITVTSADGETTLEYKITVTKKEAVATTLPKTETNQDNGNTKLILGICAIVLIIILIIVFIVIKNKQKTKTLKIYDEDGDYNEQEDDYNTYSKSEEDYSVENNETQNDEESEEEYEEDNDEDDDWGTPKRGFRNKFRKTGRHF